jgi:predicted kinase
METILFCGIQATGKTSFYKDNFLKTHIRISMDMLNTRNKEGKFVELCLSTGQPFVVDNTNPSKEDRSRYIALAKAYRFKVIGYYFQSKIEDAIVRNNTRSGKEQIPVIGIKGTYNQLELPSYAEGFDDLYYVELKENSFVIKRWENEI